MNFQKIVLDNGLRVILVPVRGVESATTLVLTGAGSRYETRQNNGISHFLEHMAFKGTAKRPTARQISSLIDGIGAESNAFTSKEITGYYIKSSSDHINLALDLLSDMLSNLKLDPAEIDKERGVILEEINLYEDTPSRKIGDIFERLLYGDTPMGWDVAGEKDVIKKITRGDFLTYMKSLYSGDNMTVVVAGNIDVGKTLDEVKHFFSPLKRFKIKSFEKTNEKQRISQVFLKHKKTEQAHFALGVRTVGLNNEKDRYPLSILSTILGGGMSSRLFHEIREKRGLAYYVRTVSEHYTDLGYLATFAGVDPKRIDQAIKLVVDEYKKVVKKGKITKTELEKAKEYVKGHFVLELEDSKSLALFFGADEILEEKNQTPEQVIEKIRNVSLGDVLVVAQKYLTSALNLAIIGDFASASPFKKLLFSRD